MGKHDDEVKQALITLIRRYSISTNVENATVISVDKDKDTCRVKTHSGEAEIPNVRLTAIVESGDTRFCIYPKVESDVTIMFFPGQDVEAVILKYSEIDDVVVKFANEFVFNDGDNGGLVKVVELVDKMNDTENKLNDLISKFNTHTHITTCGAGPGTAAVTVAPETPLPAVTTRGDIENEKVKH
jgi:hypothetical protein